MLNSLIACVLVGALAPVELNVDWTRAVGTTRPTSFGLNLFKAHDPQITASAAYQNGLRLMKPGFIRLHSWEVMGDSKSTSQGWIDHRAQTWDEEKILAALAPLAWYEGEVMVNIPSWPAWIAPTHEQLPRPEVYAKWCADFARILRKSKLRVTHLEITNEKDMPLFAELREDGGRGPLKDAARPDQAVELARVFREAARAVRNVNPNLKIGGPAAARPDLTAFADIFLQEAGPLDFYSVHTYASGSADDSLTHIFSRLKAMTDVPAELRTRVHRRTGRRIPMSLNEFNISWTWETRDPRMTNHVSAVFDALFLFMAAERGIESVAAWNEMDGVYGKLDGDGRPRPAAHLYGALNRLAVGSLHRASSSNPQLFAWATRGKAGRYLWVVNSAEVAVPLRRPPSARGARIDASGFQESVRLESLPPLSVSWFPL